MTPWLLFHQPRLMHGMLIACLTLSLLIGSVAFPTPVHAGGGPGITVNSTADNTTTNGLCTLREAIVNANNDAATYPDCAAGSGSDIIHFSFASGTVLLNSALPPVNSTLTIDGTGQAIVVDGASSYRIFEVTAAGNLSLNTLTMKNGKHTGLCWGNMGDPSCGGGIYTDGNLTIMDSNFQGNSASEGGAIFVGHGIVNVANSTFSGNSADYGGGIEQYDGLVNVQNTTFSNNAATFQGGGIDNYGGNLTVTDSTFSDNYAEYYGGSIANYGFATITNSTFASNFTFGVGGGITHWYGTLNIANSTFYANEATDQGGGIYLYQSEIGLASNSAFSSHSADFRGSIPDRGGLRDSLQGTFSSDSVTGQGGGIETVTVTNSTFSDNWAGEGGGVFQFNGTLDLSNTVIANTINGGGCVNYGTVNGNNNLIEGTTNVCGLTNGINGNLIGFDPNLNALADNGGATDTMAALPGSPAINTGNDTTCPVIDQRGVARPQGAHCDIGAYEFQYFTISGNAGVGGATLSYTDGTPKTVTSQPNGSYSFLVPYNWSGTVTPTHACFTFTPANHPYIFTTADAINQDYAPTLNVGCADINVKIGGTNQGRFGLPSPGSTRASFVGVNNGPVKLESTNAVPLIGAERVIYTVNGVNTSFSEMMALPNSQLDTSYWLPWYNNAGLDTQLRFGNVSGANATVRVFIGGVERSTCTSIPSTPYPYVLAGGASLRVSCPGLDNGPVKIQSDQNIVAAERVIYNINGINTSFSEMMALPNSQLNTTYWLPWYNNVDLDTQLRFGVP